MRSCFVASPLVGRSKANVLRSPLTEYLTRGKRHVAAAAGPPLPDREPDQLHPFELAFGEMDLRVGKLAWRVVLVIRCDSYDHGVLRLRWLSRERCESDALAQRKMASAGPRAGRRRVEAIALSQGRVTTGETEHWVARETDAYCGCQPSTALRVIPSLSSLNQSCSSITWAIANSLEWVSVSSDFVPPIFANRVAAPP